MLRTNFQTTVYGNRSTIPQLGPEDPMPRSVNHMFHCMDYLRQTILCNADLTIEWEALTVKERLPTGHIDGYGVTHQCRDWVSFLWFFPPSLSLVISNCPFFLPSTFSHLLFLLPFPSSSVISAVILSNSPLSPSRFFFCNITQQQLTPSVSL